MTREMKVELKGFSGVNNVNPESPNGSELSAAFNVDLTNSRSLRVMPGRRSVYQGTCHSAFGDEEWVYFVEGTSIKRMSTKTLAVTTLYSALTSSDPMGWLSLNGAIYASNLNDNLVIQNGVARKWGIVPPTAPVVAAEYGDLPPGQYLVALTYIRSSGLESGSSWPIQVNVTGGGISITDIPTSADALASYVGIYLSPRNSKTLYMVGVVANGTASALYRGPAPGEGRPLKTEGLSNPPGGSLLEFYHGRVYMFHGSVLWFTELGAHEYVRPKKGFIQFPDEGTMVKATENGLWVSTAKEAVFLFGQDPAAPGGLVVKTRIAYPAIKGTGIAVDGNFVGGDGVQGQAVLWASEKGYCLGANDGSIKNVTQGRFHPPQSVSGSSAFLSDGDVARYVTSFVVPDNDISLGFPQLAMSAT